MVQGGGGTESVIYAPLFALHTKTAHALELDPREAERLEGSQEYNKVYCEAIAGYTGEATLYIGNNPESTSIREHLDFYNEYYFYDRHSIRVVKSVPIKVKRLQEVVGTDCPYDFLKLNIEGIEWDILNSLDDGFLSSVIGICTEAQTIAMHKGSHTSDEILQWARDHHFVLLDVQKNIFEFQIEHNLIFVKDPLFCKTKEQLIKWVMMGFLVKDADFVAYMLRLYKHRIGYDVMLQQIAKFIGIADFDAYFAKEAAG